MRDIEQRADDAAAKRTPGVAGRFVQAAGQIVSTGFSALGDRAAERYVIDEERKNAELRAKTSYSRFMMERGDSAEALLMTGGGGKIGMEDPFSKDGEVNESIKTMAKDFADAKQAAPTYAVMADLATDIPGMMMKIGERAAEGAANASSTGLGAMPGGLLGAARGTMEAAGNITTKALKATVGTPEMIVSTGADDAAKVVQDTLGKAFGAINSSMKDYGQTLEKGGGDLQKFNDGVNLVTRAGKDVTTSFAVVVKRAGETVKSFNELNTATATTAQIERIRERYMLAATPLLQAYMNTMSLTKETLRSRYTTKEERATESEGIDRFATDQELIDRGFTPEAIGSAQLQSARALGRVGTEKTREGVTRTALRAESAGLGPTGQTIQAATAIARTGEKDPGAALERSITKAFIAGFRDSREMQGLLQAASDTAENTMDFEGAVDRMVSLVGTGRPGEAKDIKQFMDELDKQWSGTTGNMEDMVKFNLLQSQIGNLKGEGGASPSDKVRKDLRKLQVLKPSQITDEWVETHLSKETRDFIDEANRAKYGDNYKKEGKSVIKDISRTMITRGATFGAALVGQKEEGADIVEGRKVLESGSPEDIKKKWPTKEKFEDFLRLVRTNAEIYSGDANQGLTAAQNIANLYKDKTGEAVNVPGMQGVPTAPTEEPFGASAEAVTPAERKDVDKARAEAAKRRTGERIAKRKGEGGKDMLQSAADLTVEERELEHIKALAETKKPTTVSKEEVEKNRLVPIEKSLSEMREGFEKMADAFKDFSLGQMALTVTGDLVVKSAKAITGAVVDAGVSAVSKAIGNDIVGSIQKGLGMGGKPTAPENKPGTTPENKSPGTVK
jgi:hypothetical protein